MGKYLFKVSYKKHEILTWNKLSGFEVKIAIHLSIISANLKLSPSLVSK